MAALLADIFWIDDINAIVKKATVATQSDLYALLVAMSAEALLLHSEGQIVLANEAAALLFGARSAAQLAGQDASDFLPGPAAASLSRQVSAYPHRRSAAAEIRRLDGSAVEVKLLERACSWQASRPDNW